MQTGLTTFEFCVRENLTGVGAVILTHLFGYPIHDTVEIATYFKNHGIYIIEDCAQAAGAKLGDKYMGTFSDLSCFSFYPTKNLGCLGDAGGIATSNAELSHRLFKLRTYGWSSKYCVELPSGRNSRLDELQAGFLRVFLRELVSDNYIRMLIANRYLSAISVDGINPVHPSPGTSPSYHLFPIVTKHRSKFVNHLTSCGVSSAIHYPIPDNKQSGFQLAFTSLLNSEKFAEEVVSIPIFPELTAGEIDHVIESVNSFSC
jgi:dTDP-4-amino-4,6-dideoxygalactose transaminase